MEINVVYCLFIVDFIHLASRRKIIKHHVVGGTRESHPRVSKICNIHDSASLVVDCKSWTLGKDSLVPPATW